MDVTLLAVGFTSMPLMCGARRENQLGFSFVVGYHVVSERLELVNMVTHTVYTQTDLAVIAELMSRLGTKVTGHDLLRFWN